MSNQNLIIILVAMILLIYVPCSIIVIYLMRTINREISYSRLLKENQMNLELKQNEDDFVIIDNLVIAELDLYILRETELKGNNNLYMTDTMQQEAKREILGNVLKKISPLHLAKLKYIYNEEVIEDIIFEKVQSAVINFSADNNSILIDNKKPV